MYVANHSFVKQYNEQHCTITSEHKQKNKAIDCWTRKTTKSQWWHHAPFKNKMPLIAMKEKQNITLESLCIWIL